MKSNGKKRKYEILLLVETSRVYGRDIIRGVTRYATEQSGTWYVQFHDRGSGEKPPNWLEHWVGDGIITRSSSKRMEKIIREHGVPFVELCGTSSIPEVVCDDKKNGQMAAEHFFSRGFRNFAYFGIGNSWWVRWRQDNFLHAVKSYGMACQCFIQKSNSRSLFSSWDKTNEDKLIQWIRELPKPTGLYCASEINALVIVDVCRKAGIKIPHEIAVLGVDNDETICSLSDPQISSIETNGFQVGYKAAWLLHQRMQGTRCVVKTPILIPPLRVVTRHSTDLIAIEDEDVAAAIHFIRMNATSGITVTDVENHVSISHTTLFRKFLRYLGHSPEREIINVRILQAKQLLCETNLSLDHISSQVGITPTSYFVRVFKRETGETPQRFRMIQK